MKTADIDEIFNGPTATEANEEFWQKATFGVPVVDPLSSELDAYDAVDKPLQKTREEMRKDGIDSSPMMSVAEIRAKFSKGSAPIFPKQVFGFGTPSHAGTRSSQISPTSRTTERDKSLLSTQHDNDNISNVRGGIQPPDQAPPSIHADDIRAPERVKISGAVHKGEDSAAQQPASLVKPLSENITMDEFLEIAKFHGCYEAIQRYSEPSTIDVVIKPEISASTEPAATEKPGIIVKQMLLQFNKEQRLLVMLRQGAIRYIRLNDVIKIDGSEICLNFLGTTELPVQTQRREPIALYFRTTKHPMVIMVETETDREALFKLIIFLRQLLKTSNPLEILA